MVPPRPSQIAESGLKLSLTLILSAERTVPVAAATAVPPTLSVTLNAPLTIGKRGNVPDFSPEHSTTPVAVFPSAETWSCSSFSPACRVPEYFPFAVGLAATATIASKHDATTTEPILNNIRRPYVEWPAEITHGV